jgi:hypothetical protein
MGANKYVPVANFVMAAQPVGADAWAVLQLLLSGKFSAAQHLANALRVDAYGRTTFGRTDAVDLFAAHPLDFSSQARVLRSPQAIAVVDDMADGRTVGAFADLVDGVIARLWVVAFTFAAAADATPEPMVPVACDDFLSQIRERCLGDPVDHPDLQADAWPRVVELCNAVLGELPSANDVASSSQAWVMRAFSSASSVVALVRWRLQFTGLQRRTHHRIALVIADNINALGNVQDAREFSRLALSDPLLEPAPVSL